MTIALWVIAVGILALAAIIGYGTWMRATDSRLDVLTEADVADLTRPYVDQLSVMALDDAPAPDSVFWNGHQEP
jgi:hypothetical protein